MAVELLKHNLTLLGTIRSHRKEIPPVLREKKRPIESSRLLFDHDNKITLVSYIPKRNKNVILLSSSHTNDKTIPSMANKPQLILDYNFGKKGVDQLDEAIEEFSCRRKTARWPLLLFFNMLDVAAYNGFVIMKKCGFVSSRKQFLRIVSIQLAEEYAKKRFERNQHLRRSTKEAGNLFGFLPDVSTSSTVNANCRVSRCKECNKNTRSKCDVCLSFICPNHRHLIKTCVCSICKR